MYQNLHPATSNILKFVFHMNNGLIEAALHPHIMGDADHDDSTPSSDEERRHLWKTPTRGVIFLPNTADVLQRSSSEDSDGDPSNIAKPTSYHDAPRHLLLSPELAASLQALPLNVSDTARAHVYAEPEAAARHVRIFARNEAFEETSPRGWVLLGREIAFNATSLRRGIDLRIDTQEHISEPSNWDGHASIRLDIIDGGMAESDLVAARVAPVLHQHPEKALGAAGDTKFPHFYSRFV